MTLEESGEVFRALLRVEWSGKLRTMHAAGGGYVRGTCPVCGEPERFVDMGGTERGDHADDCTLRRALHLVSVQITELEAVQDGRVP